MPNPGADRPLRKVTLNLYEEDCATLEQHYGHGWTTNVRAVVNDECIGLRKLKDRPEYKPTLGDMFE